MVGCEAYIICTSPRSGSTLLCRMLEATGCCGVPDSHFHEASVAAWLADHSAPLEGYTTDLDALRTAIRAGQTSGTGDTGTFGLRLQSHSFLFFMDQLRLLNPCEDTDASRITAAFGQTRFIHLSRASKLEQAISYLKARQTGLWHRAPDGSEIERLSAPRPIEYSRDAIAALIAEFEAYDRDWNRWFAGEGIAPLRVGYEALAATPRSVLAEVLTFLGLSGELALEAAIPVARLSDEVNRDWALRYCAETGLDHQI